MTSQNLVHEIVYSAVQEIIPRKLEEQILRCGECKYYKKTAETLTNRVERTCMSRNRRFSFSPIGIGASGEISRVAVRRELLREPCERGAAVETSESEPNELALESAAP